MFHASLPQYLIDDLERVQKRALSIASPTLSCANALAALDLETPEVHHQRLSQSLFDNILEDRDHRLHHLLPDLHRPQYTLRHARIFDVLSFHMYIINEASGCDVYINKVSICLPI